jgi:hypothetical protein
MPAVIWRFKMERYIRIISALALLVTVFLYVDLPFLQQWDEHGMGEQIRNIAFNLVVLGFAIDHGADPRYQGSAFIVIAAFITLCTYFL